jgi:hypothetical protein
MLIFVPRPESRDTGRPASIIIAATIPHSEVIKERCCWLLVGAHTTHKQIGSRWVVLVRLCTVPSLLGGAACSARPTPCRCLRAAATDLLHMHDEQLWSLAPRLMHPDPDALFFLPRG